MSADDSVTLDENWHSCEESSDSDTDENWYSFDESSDSDDEQSSQPVSKYESSSEEHGPCSEYSEDSSKKERTSDQSQASGVNLKTDKCDEALHYFPNEMVISSDDSKKLASGETSIESSCIVEFRPDDTGSMEYVDIEYIVAIQEKDVAELMQKLRVDHYSAAASQADSIYVKCKALFEKDYICEAIDNSGGSLSINYPERLIVPFAKKSNNASAERIETLNFDKEHYAEQLKKSVSSRLRARFVAPVILFDNKFICRSGTLTVRKTSAFEIARRTKPPQSQNVEHSGFQRVTRNVVSTVVDVSNRGCQAATQLLSPSSMQKLKAVDASILKDLNIQYICDLMIEKRKSFSYIRLSSSEKINPKVYSDCNIEQMPYPGCKFFRRYHEANHVPDDLVFNWNRPDANVELKFSRNPCIAFPDINWQNYQEWDVVSLTKNYLKILLLHLAEGTGGLLVHCVSGWDRTPLFISMLRVSLWVDGVIHQSLNYEEMAYLTLAYDWYLFGHNLPKRLKKKEEIMHFCFQFLPRITSDEFSITRIFHELTTQEKAGRTLPDFERGRRGILDKFSSYVLKIYDEFITQMIV